MAGVSPLPTSCQLDSCDADVCPPELDLLPFSVTFLLSFWEVQYGIIGGVAVSGVMLLYNVARPTLKVMEVCVFVHVSVRV